MIYETKMNVYLKLKECLSELCPEIEVKLISSDPMLKVLGFVDDVPCKVEVCASDSRIEEIRDMVMEFETDAFNTPDGEYPNTTNSDYIKYLRYGWMFDFLISV